MEAKLDNKLLMITKYSEDELNELRKLITWDYEENDPETGESTTISETLLFEEEGKVFTFWGLHDLLEKQLSNFKVMNPIEYGFDRIEVPYDLLDEIEFYKFQASAIQKSIMIKRGILDIPTGGGKTEILLGTVKLLFKLGFISSALIIVPSVYLAGQTVQRALARGFLRDQIGIIGGGEKESGRSITVAVIHSLNIGIKENREDILSIIRNSEYIGIDECFAGNSRVLLPNGEYTTIEEIYNDLSIESVMSFNEKSRVLEEKKIVRRIKKSYNKHLMKIEYNLNGETKKLFATPNHKVFTKNKGYVQMQDLIPGDIIISFKPERLICPNSIKNEIEIFISNHDCIVTKKGTTHGGKSTKEVFNLEVEDNHNYVCEGILVSNCHHLRAFSWKRVALNTISAKYIFGYSGSPFHENDVLTNAGDTLVYAIAGKPFFTVTQRYLREVGLIPTPYIYFERIGAKIFKYPGRYNVLYDRYIVEGTKRNNKILRWAMKFQSIKCPTLILVQRKEHGLFLLQNIPGNRAVCVFGGGESHQKNEIGIIEPFNIDHEIFCKNFNSGMWDVLIATQVFDEGIDIPQVGAVILAGAGKCFVAGTKVSLLSGKECNIEDVREGDFVYSCTPEGDVLPGKVIASSQTGETKKLVEVTIDNGKKERCTPDHLWQLRDGTYKEAQHLISGESLMPLNKEINHKVLSVKMITLSNPIPIYDLEISNSEDTSNFALSSGIFVHNSKIKFFQRVGRGLRKKKNQPNRVYLIDFEDREHIFFYSQYKKRLEMGIVLLEMEQVYNPGSLFQMAIDHYIGNI